MAFNQEVPEPQNYIAYPDLSGGRNTKKDPHALDRNQLYVSDNTWMQTGNALSKRPGNLGVQISAGSFGANGLNVGISLGQTGAGVSLGGLVEARFISMTCLVVQGVNNQLYAAALNPLGPSVTTFISIGAISGGRIAATQLYDPDPTTGSKSPDGSLFIVDGVDTPKVWYGPGNTLRAIATSQLPTKSGSNAPITPKYVASIFSSLFYAGDESDPSMVYISNPFLPQQFTQNQLIPTGTITSSSYIGQPIGRGDGIDGGAITGLARMGSAMIVYKESAIYAMTQVGLLGDMVYGSSVASSSVGAISPRSIVPFDTFHVFLGIDGVYTFDGSNTRKISENNPDLFDGPTAQIMDRTSAIGVRYGNRYLIFFDNGNGTGAKVGYPCAGAWFDFGKLDSDGFPCCGTISGMNVSGVAALRSGLDYGNFAWSDATKDMVSSFAASSPQSGFPLYTDNGTQYTVSVTAKADLFTDANISYTERYNSEAAEDLKSIDSAHLFMSFPLQSANQRYTFNGTVYYDQYNTQTSTGYSQAFPTNGMAAIVGQAIVGQAVVAPPMGIPAFQHIPMFQGTPGSGYIIQLGWTETSPFPWTSLGFALNLNRQRRVGIQSG